MGDWISAAEVEASEHAALVSRLSGGDSALVEEMVLRAESRARSRLGRRRLQSQLPAAGEAPAELKRILADLTVFFLGRSHDLIGPQVRDLGLDALRELDEIAEGLATLGDAGDPEIDQAAASVSLVTRPSTETRLSLADLEGM